MRKQKPTVALIYDFDGTLSPGNMQEFGFIQALKKDKGAFWKESTTLSNNNNADGILCYMYLMLQKAQSENISLQRKSFQEFGKKVELFHGVNEWFKLINKYGSEKGLIIDQKFFLVEPLF